MVYRQSSNNMYFRVTFFYAEPVYFTVYYHSGYADGGHYLESSVSNSLLQKKTKNKEYYYACWPIE